MDTLSVLITELPKNFRPKTAGDVARLLVDREIHRRAEKQGLAAASDTLQAQRCEMLSGFPATASPETIEKFKRLAAVISEERIGYSVRDQEQDRLSKAAKRRNRDLDRLRALRLSLENEWRRSLHSFSAAGDRRSDIASDLRAWRQAIEALDNLCPAPPPQIIVAWHASAIRIAAAYSILSMELQLGPKTGMRSGLSCSRFMRLASRTALSAAPFGRC